MSRADSEIANAGGGADRVLDIGSKAGALRSWRRQQAGERILVGGGWPEADYVFTWADGSLPWTQRVTAWFRAHSEALGLPNLGVHGLRHSAATWMIAFGVSLKVVTQRLGHSHVSVTLQL